jgi:hypothetical protein
VKLGPGFPLEFIPTKVGTGMTGVFSRWFVSGLLANSSSEAIDLSRRLYINETPKGFGFAIKPFVSTNGGEKPEHVTVTSTGNLR